MAVDLAEAAKRRKIKCFLISFVDLFGVLRSNLVPARAIADIQKEGAGFAGFAVWLDMTPAHPDMFSIPDPNGLIQLPDSPSAGEASMMARCTGKTNLHNVEPEDLCALTLATRNATGAALVGTE